MDRIIEVRMKSSYNNNNKNKQQSEENIIKSTNIQSAIICYLISSCVNKFTC